MSTKVHFDVYVVESGELKTLSEEDIAASFTNLQKLLSQQSVIEGALVIEIQGQLVVRIEDELVPGVQNLCFASIPTLLEEKRECFLYRYMSSEGHIVLIPLASLVRIMGEHVPTVTDTMQTLFPALFECGLRFIQLLQRMEAEQVASARYLQSFADKARDTLQKLQLLKGTD